MIDFLKRSGKKKRKKIKTKFYKKRWFIILVSILLILIISAGLSYNSAKAAYQYAMLGKDKILSAPDLLSEMKLEEAVQAINDGLDNFRAADQQVNRLVIFKYIPLIGRQVRAVDDLLSAGVDLGQAASQIADLGLAIYEIAGNSEDVNFAEVTEEQKEQILQKISEAQPLLKEVKVDLDQASSKIDDIPSFGLLPQVKGAVDLVKEKLAPIQESINSSLPIVEVLPGVFGYPEPKTYLFLLQNNSELRPAGGFIGTYGLITLEGAEIDDFWTDNVYNIDEKNKNTLFIDPPWQLARYLGSKQWFLRDSNWSPDFPTAAEQAIWFYGQEGGQEELDGVIAVTPTFIQSLIELVGDITVHGITFNKDNFVDVLQYQVEQGYYQQGIAMSERKEVIGDLAKILLDKILALPQTKFGDLWSTLLKDTTEKQVLLYLKDESSQQIILEQNWGGKLQTGNGDFLYLVDANLASLKSDPTVERTINYLVNEKNGEYQAQVSIKYNHTGDFDWKTTRYRTYSRIYVPKGSELISTSGSMANDRSNQEGEIEVGEENGRTVFGTFISIEPKETGILTFTYRLPEYIKDQINEGKYTLTVQKQAGTIAHTLNLNLNFGHDVKSWHPLDKGSQDDNNNVIFSSDLSQDRSFAINL